jgi:hypothetical protein
MYQLSDAEVEELRVAPDKAFPKMAAQLHYNVQLAAYQGILSVLPQVISQQMREFEVNTGHEKNFFEKWPALRSALGSNPDAQRIIVGAINSYRQVNPKASLEDTIAQAGMLAMMSLRLPLPLPGQAPSAPANGAVPAQASVPAMPPRPPGVGTTGHVPPSSASGTDEGQGLIDSIVREHEAGNI